jgi:hypothetical protein
MSVISQSSVCQSSEKVDSAGSQALPDSRTPPSASATGSGLICPRCGHRRWRVLYTRAATHKRLVRRRECRACEYRVTTWERIIGHGAESAPDSPAAE